MSTKSIQTIIICGGHLAPALSVMEILRQKKKYRIIYVGRKSSLEGDKSKSLEYNTIINSGILLKTITTGRLQRHLSFFSIISLLKIPVGIVQSLMLLIKEKPDAVVSFGGYVAFPVGVAAWFCRVPLILHEQTRVLGMTNRILSKFASVICLSDDSLKGQTSYKPVVVTGIPLRESILHPKKNNLVNFGNIKLPLICITGGSQGARSINKSISEIIPDLVDRYRILHQCGNANSSADFQYLSKIRKTFPPEFRDNYQIVTHVDPDAVGYILKNSFFAISRAGANTIAEIESVGVPAIFIPLPWAADQEQLLNARRLVSAGSAIIIPQEQVTNEKLLAEIKLLTKNIKNFQLNAARLSKKMPHDSAKRLAAVIENTIAHGKNS